MILGFVLIMIEKNKLCSLKNKLLTLKERLENCILQSPKSILILFVNFQMTTLFRGGGRGNTPRRRGREKAKVSLSLSYIDDEGFTIVAKNIAKKRGRYSTSSSSHQEVISSQQAKTIAEIVTKRDTKYISKDILVYVFYIKEEDLSLIDHLEQIRSNIWLHIKLHSYQESLENILRLL